MKVFCPNCGTDTEGSPGARVTCTACTATFEVPSETGATRPPQPAEPPARPPDVQAASPAQPPLEWTRGPPPATLAPARPSLAPPRAAQASGGVNGLAIASLVGGMTCCLPLLSPGLGLGLGIVAMQQIETSNPPQGGKGLAIAGIVLGSLSGVLQLLWLIGVLLK